jgi:hypothetical protein
MSPPETVFTLLSSKAEKDLTQISIEPVKPSKLLPRKRLRIASWIETSLTSFLRS